MAEAEAQVIVVTSGKGGVGKTTTSANLGIGLGKRGYRVAIIDFDVGLRNLDLIMGCERRVVYDLINVIEGEGKLKQALIRDKNCENVFILPSSQTRDKDKLTQEGVKRVIDELKSKENNFDFIICDSPAGIEHGAKMAMMYADRAIVVTNPEVSSMHDSDRVIGLLDQVTESGHQMHKELLVTRYSPRRVKNKEMLEYEDIVSMLNIPSIGIIPECESILSGSNSGKPAILTEDSDASIGYEDAIDRFLGKDVTLKFLNEKKGFFGRVFARGK